jgi:hypothetical protein
LPGCVIVIHNQNAPFHSHSPGRWGAVIRYPR